MGRRRVMLECQYEQMLVNFPNLLEPTLVRMKRGDFGQVEVYLRQVTHGERRIDLAFVTGTVVHLIELKRDIIDENTFRQWSSYYEVVRCYYPEHGFRGYLVGERCVEGERLHDMIGALPVRILLYGKDIPHWSEVRGCPRCGLGLVGEAPCARCARELLPG